MEEDMKYTKPIYENEAIETNDIVTASVTANPVKVSTINKVIELDNKETITVEATEVRFDVSSLFGN